MEELTIKHEEPHYVKADLSDRETVIKKKQTVEIPDNGHLNQVVTPNRESVIKRVSTVEVPDYGRVKQVVLPDKEAVVKKQSPVHVPDYGHMEQVVLSDRKAVVKKESSVEVSDYGYMEQCFLFDVNSVIKEEVILQDPQFCSLGKLLSSNTNAVVMEENIVQASNYKLSKVKVCPKEENVVQASDYTLSDEKVCPKEEYIVQASDYTLSDVKVCPKEENIVQSLVTTFSDEKVCPKEENIVQSFVTALGKEKIYPKEENIGQTSNYALSDVKVCPKEENIVQSLVTALVEEKICPKEENIVLTSNYPLSDVKVCPKEENIVQSLVTALGVEKICPKEENIVQTSNYALSDIKVCSKEENIVQSLVTALGAEKIRPKEENIVQTSNHALSDVKVCPKEENILQVPNYTLSDKKCFSLVGNNVITEEVSLQDSHLRRLLEMNFPPNTNINIEKENNILDDPQRLLHLLEMPPLSDMNSAVKEENIQASDNAHGGKKSYPLNMNTAVKKEVILEDPQSLLHLLEKSTLMDVTDDIKKEVISNNSDYNHHTLYTQKFVSSDVNSAFKDKLSTEDKKTEQLAGQSVSTHVKNDSMEIIVLDDLDDEQCKVSSEKQLMNNFSSEHTHFLRTALLNTATIHGSESQFRLSHSASDHVVPMELENTSDVETDNQISLVGDKKCGSIKNVQQMSLTMQGTSVLNKFYEIENAFKGNVKTFYYKNQKEDCKDVSSLLTYLHLIIENILYNMVLLYGALKFSIFVECTYVKPVENKLQNRVYKTKIITLYHSTSLRSILDNIIKEICQEETTCMDLDSVWTILHINRILLRITQFKPLRGSSYIRLPKHIIGKKCVKNPKNTNDEYCFKWAILSRYIPHNSDRVNRRYFELENKFNFKNIDFPTPLKQIERFEKNNNNNISINVYGIDKNKLIFPLRICNEEKPEHFDLLLLSNRLGQYHYCYIKDLGRLVGTQLTRRKHKIDICRLCLSYFSIKSNKLKPHREYCGKYIPRQVTLPTKNENNLKFKHFHHQFRVPIVAYANFECILKSSSSVSYMPTFSTTNEFRDPASFCIYFVIDSDIPDDIRNKLPTEPYVYRGEYVAQKFMSYVTKIVDLTGIFMKDIKPLKMGKEDTVRFTSTTHCELCNCKFTKSVKPVRDYCHLTGKFRSVLCGTCNLQRQKQRFVSIFIHTNSNYDFHYLIHQLGGDIKNIHVSTDPYEKYIFFTKTASSGLFIRFIDINHFLNDSLASLSGDMPKDQFHHMQKFFSVNDMPLISKKCIFPYEYTDTQQKLEECQIPTKDKFVIKSNRKTINDEEYDHVIQMWHHFSIKTLGEYGDLMLKLDVLWSCDIFEYVRTLCLSTYKLDCAYYFSISDFAFNTLLNCTKIELELVTDNDMYMLLEQGMRNGISRCVRSASSANNQHIKEMFDASKPIKFLPYLEVNDLNGWAMCKCMPYGGFVWRNPDDNLDILNVADDALIGFILEVDVEYPQHLYEEHSDLPFLHINEVVSGPKQITLHSLLTTQMSRKNYVCHYVNLKQAIKHGLKITKIHRILQFFQSPWLKTFIKSNAEKQQQAKSNFEKVFIKLINRTIFEKCMENVRKQLSVELVNSEHVLQKRIVLPTFVDRIIYNESLCAVLSLKKLISCNKPIYLGFTILELSKTLIYEFHYDVMKRKYGKNISLLYVDTDSILYEVKTDDFYKDIIDPELSEYFDISEGSLSHMDHSSKKVLRKFKEKCKNTPVKEFVGVRAKLYSIKTSNHNT